MTKMPSTFITARRTATTCHRDWLGSWIDTKNPSENAREPELWGNHEFTTTTETAATARRTAVAPPQ
jgi:hypothetical protein